MGMDVSMHVVVGALVDVTEILDTEEQVKYKCKECKVSHVAKQKFCGECGHKFKPVRIDRWKPSVKTYLDQDMGGVDDEPNLGEFYDSGPFLNVSAVQCSVRDSEETWAIGVKCGAEVDSNDSPGAVPITTARFEEAKAEVLEILEGMGLKPREVSIFPVLYVSV